MELEKIIKDSQNIDRLDNVIKTPVYSVLIEMIKLIPVIGGLTDEIVKNRVSEYQKQKRKALVEYINNDKQIRYSDDVNDVEFLINFAKTLEAVDRISSSEKIRYFANLIKESYLKTEKTNVHYYDEFLDTLNGLSYREIDLLCEVYRYEISLTSPDEFIWKNLYENITVNVSFDTEEIKSIFMRLQGKGLMYAENEINYLTTAESPPEKKGTTKYSRKFISIIIGSSE